MSFTVSTCITFNGTTPSTGPFDIYLDSDYDSTPILTEILLSEVTGINCPYEINNIPNGTINLGFKDTNLGYCSTIPILDNQICYSCNLGLSNYSATTITRLSCGVLTGSCQTITDYIINWYGPNSLTNIYFSSGSGDAFDGEYTQPHPFLNDNSLPLPEGVYIPVIEKVILNDVIFSNTGGTGNILTDLNSCLPSTTIQPFTCSNQTNNTNEYPYYKHRIYYEFFGANIPITINLTYKVSATTEYWAWMFQGYGNDDRIQIKFSGSSYGNNIINLEDFVVGSNNTPNFTQTTFPKSAQTPYFLTKLTCLTGLTVNNNDNILITVTPASNDTKWLLFATCLSSYDCSNCLTTNKYKIIGSTITGITNTCTEQIKFSISGCNYDNYISSDLYKFYFSFGVPNQSPSISNTPSDLSLYPPYYDPQLFSSKPYIINQNSCSNSTIYLPGPGTCSQDTNNVTYSKTYVGGVGSKGIIGITGSSVVISTHYNSWINAVTNYSGSSSNTDASYYRYFLLKIPEINSASNNCFENAFYTYLNIHPSSKVSTGTTGSGSYYFRLTAETISNNFTANTSCDIGCSALTNNYVSLINNSSTGSTISGTRTFVYTPGTSNFGVYYTGPFIQGSSVAISKQTLSAQTINSFFDVNDWTMNTIPYSGGSNTLIPSFSGTLCNYNTLGVRNSAYGSFYNRINLFYYYIISSNLTDFEIWSAPIVNYSADTNFNNAILVYRYSGGNVTYSSSTYIIG